MAFKGWLVLCARCKAKSHDENHDENHDVWGWDAGRLSVWRENTFKMMSFPDMSQVYMALRDTHI